MRRAASLVARAAARAAVRVCGGGRGEGGQKNAWPPSSARIPRWPPASSRFTHTLPSLSPSHSLRRPAAAGTPCAALVRCVFGGRANVFFDGVPPDKRVVPAHAALWLPAALPLGLVHACAHSLRQKGGRAAGCGERGRLAFFFLTPSCTPVSPVASASAAAPLASPWACR